MANELELRASLASAKLAREAADARPDKAGFGAANGEARRKQAELSREICKGLACHECGRALYAIDTTKGEVQISCPFRVEHKDGSAVVTAADSAAAREAWARRAYDPATVKAAALKRGGE